MVPARTREDITGFFGELTLAEPGLTDIWAWRPDGDTVSITTDFMRILGGAARKAQSAAYSSIGIYRVNYAN